MIKLQLIIKRFIDIICSAIGFLLFPVMLLIAALIKVTSKGPVFFLQQRVGKDGELFKLFKFRTMIPGAVTKGNRSYYS